MKSATRKAVNTFNEVALANGMLRKSKYLPAKIRLIGRSNTNEIIRIFFVKKDESKFIITAKLVQPAV